MHLFSYLDAGTGSMFIQAILGVFLAVSVVMRTHLRRLFSKVKLLFRPKTGDEEA